MERNGHAEGEIDRALLAEIEAIMGGDGIVSHRSELKVYECDGWTIEKNAPDLLLMPRTTTSVVVRGIRSRSGAFFSIVQPSHSYTFSSLRCDTMPSPPIIASISASSARSISPSACPLRSINPSPYHAAG